MTRLFCDRCGREIKGGHFEMHVTEHDSGEEYYKVNDLCAACINEYADWYMLRHHDEFLRSKYHDAVEEKSGARRVIILEGDE